MRASDQGRRFLAYFFGAVAKELGRQQAKRENEKSNKRSALKTRIQSTGKSKSKSLDPGSKAYRDDEKLIFMASN